MADACRSRRLRFGAWPDAEWISCLLRERWRHRRKRHRARRSRRVIQIGLSVASSGFAMLVPCQYSKALLSIAATSSVDLMLVSVQSPRWLRACGLTSSTS